MRLNTTNISKSRTVDDQDLPTMGAWGTKAFDNDAACDWKATLLRGADLSPVKRALFAVLAHEDSYLESNVAAEALAACEVLARLKGHWGYENPYTKSVDDWVRSHSGVAIGNLADLADRAIDRILGDNSELAELWAGNEEWQESVGELRLRVMA